MIPEIIRPYFPLQIKPRDISTAALAAGSIPLRFGVFLFQSYQEDDAGQEKSQTPLRRDHSSNRPLVEQSNEA
jgi:hypothetical protein